MGAASAGRGPGRRRCVLVATVAAACAVAWLAAAARERELGLLHASRTSSDGLLRAAEPEAACGRWQTASVLGGGCLAELPPSTTSFECCGGPNYTCHSAGYACPAQALLPALRCVSPRHMLLRPLPGCSLSSGGGAAGGAAGHATRAAQPRVPLQQCPPSVQAVAGGSWVEVSSPVAPGVPSLQFQPACSPPRSGSLYHNMQPLVPPPPLAGPEALQRLWAAGFDRVLVSGDSTVRHLYNRLVALIRQQDSVIDGGGIAHAHYKLQLWPGGGGMSSSSGSGSQGGDAASGSSSGASAGSAVRGTASGARTLLGGAAAAEALATDELWVSPPANFVKGDWDEEYMEEGLLHMLTRTFAPTSSGSSSSSSGSGSGNSNSGSGNSSGTSGPQLTVDFVVGAHARWQMRHVRRYLAELADAPGADGSRVLAVLSLCVWEQKHIWPNGWLDFLAEVRQQVGQVVLLTCPTDRIRRDNQQEGRKLVAQRNQLLREMIAAERGGSAAAAAESGGVVERQLQTRGEGGGSKGGPAGGRPRPSSGAAGSGAISKSSSSSSSKGDGGASGSTGSSSAGPRGGSEAKPSRGGSDPQPAVQPLMLVDIDGLTRDLPPGLAVAPLDYHYACMLANPNGYNSTGEMRFTGGDGRPQPAYQPMRYDRLLVPPAGRCDDPVNFAGLQLLLSLL